MTQRYRENPIVERFGRAIELYSGRAAAIKESYEAYFQFDKLRQQGFESVATSDIRSTVDIGVHILASHMHLDRLPKSIQSPAEQQKRDKAERAVRGWWRQVDNGQGGYLRQGRSWHQKELAAWLILTGWGVQYTAMTPCADGTPMPIADLLDPTRCFPFWEGPYGELSSLYYIFSLSGTGFRNMLHSKGIAVPDGIDDNAEVSIMDYWEERYNDADASQPDILNTLNYAIGEYGQNTNSSNFNWVSLRNTMNFSPNSSDIGQENGFHKLPFIIIRPDGSPIASSYQATPRDLLKLTAGGMVAPMKKEWEDLNKWMSTLREEIKQVMRFNATVQVSSPGANVNMENDELGEINQVDSDTSIFRPLPRGVEVAGAVDMQVREIQRRMQKLSIIDEVVGMTDRALSGVAMKAVQEGGRVHLQPYSKGMEFLYADSGKIFLDDYVRRYSGSDKGNIRVQGKDVRFGFFDEDFTVKDVPESTYMESELRLAMPEDDMMKANIFRALNPQARLSLPYLRENVMGIQDLGYEAEQLAADNIEQNPINISRATAMKFFDMAEADEQKGDMDSAQINAFVGMQILQSIVPQQGQGNAERGGQGPPAAGGNMTNAGGANPALSPENMTTEPPGVAAPAGGGAMEQAIRNAGGM